MQRIILLLMVKNEGKIIERCISSVLPLVDAVFLLDTGSEDDTIEKARKVVEENGKIFSYSVEEWKNFGYNRSISFERCFSFCSEQGFDLSETYALLLDADMKIVYQNPFPSLKNVGYYVTQKNKVISYHNIRLLRMDGKWKCHGSTHEYWGSELENIFGTIDMKEIYIDDVGDGGSKGDKFERDKKLLLQELEEKPNDQRTLFYLAQTYRDIGDKFNALKYYHKRVEVGGWYEEVWYSMFSLVSLYLSLDFAEEAEMWTEKTYPHRAEAVYEMTKYHRIKGNQKRAYEYYLIGKKIQKPTIPLLFLHDSVYDFLFDYEFTILAYYLDMKLEARKESISYLNIPNSHYHFNVYDNLKFYCFPLEGKNTSYSFEEFGEYHSSSSSLLPLLYNSNKEDKFLLNIRYVNYTIDKDGRYSFNDRVKTKNYFCLLDSKLQPTNNPILIDDDSHSLDTDIIGYEDLRLFQHHSKILFFASQKTEENIRIVQGEYDLENERLINIIPIQSPENNYCEKNWTYLPESKNEIRIIYRWGPFTKGTVIGEKVILDTPIKMPLFFEHLRGSSQVIKWKEYFYTLTHIVIGDPRSYYHVLVKMDQNFVPIAYSLPFAIEKMMTIEYCLSIWIEEKKEKKEGKKEGKKGKKGKKKDFIKFIYSHMDRNTSLKEVPFSSIIMVNI